jgi:hypothetical protein
LQAANAGLEYAFSPLAVDIRFEVARHGRDDFDLMLGEELCKIAVPGLLEYGQVAAVHDVDADGAGSAHQVAKVRVQLGRTAGNVETRDARGF